MMDASRKEGVLEEFFAVTVSEKATAIFHLRFFKEGGIYTPVARVVFLDGESNLKEHDEIKDIRFIVFVDHRIYLSKKEGEAPRSIEDLER